MSGSGNVKVGKNTLLIEIDTADLSKIKNWFTVSLINAQKQNMLGSKVTEYSAVEATINLPKKDGV